MKTYEVKAHWDDDSGVWRAKCPDMPGLVADATTVEALLEKLRDRVPDALVGETDVNGFGAPVPFRLIADRTVWASRHMSHMV